jgi:hypothetical protein
MIGHCSACHLRLKVMVRRAMQCGRLTMYWIKHVIRVETARAKPRPQNRYFSLVHIGSCSRNISAVVAAQSAASVHIVHLWLVALRLLYSHNAARRYLQSWLWHHLNLFELNQRCAGVESGKLKLLKPFRSVCDLLQIVCNLCLTVTTGNRSLIDSVTIQWELVMRKSKHFATMNTRQWILIWLSVKVSCNLINCDFKCCTMRETTKLDRSHFKSYFLEWTIVRKGFVYNQIAFWYKPVQEPVQMPIIKKTASPFFSTTFILNHPICPFILNWLLRPAELFLTSSPTRVSNVGVCWKWNLSCRPTVIYFNSGMRYALLNNKGQIQHFSVTERRNTSKAASLFKVTRPSAWRARQSNGPRPPASCAPSCGKARYS